MRRSRYLRFDCVHHFRINLDTEEWTHEKRTLRACEEVEKAEAVMRAQEEGRRRKRCREEESRGVAAQSNPGDAGAGPAKRPTSGSHSIQSELATAKSSWLTEPRLRSSVEVDGYPHPGIVIPMCRNTVGERIEETGGMPTVGRQKRVSKYRVDANRSNAGVALPVGRRSPWVMSFPRHPWPNRLPPPSWGRSPTCPPPDVPIPISMETAATLNNEASIGQTGILICTRFIKGRCSF